MLYTLEIAPVAKAELHEAYRWYEAKRLGLGMDFLLCAEEAMETILRNPKAYQNVTPTIRRKIMARFPYGIFFRLRGNVIEVIAIVHNHRDPVAWRKRV